MLQCIAHWRIPSQPMGHLTLLRGFFRDCASGNVFNMANIDVVWDNINKYNHPNGEPKKGRIYLYISELNPLAINIAQSDFVATVYDTAKCQTVQDVMRLGSCNYSPIWSKFFSLFLQSIDRLHI